MSISIATRRRLIRNCDPLRPLQLKDFFGSITTLRADAMGNGELERIAGQPGLSRNTGEMVGRILGAGAA